VAKIELTYTPAQNEIFFSNTDKKFKVIPKGRRLGVTRGAAHAFIEWSLDQVGTMLWVDTINGNIDRYMDRYFFPALKQLPKTKWDWNQQKKILRIYDNITDFRSADSPESIEGFGYKKIFLNEAGIILKDDYLYSNAILPMMLDYPDSQLIAAGVPKGKIKKDGSTHKFYELWENVLRNEPGYWGKIYSTFDNPLLTKIDIETIISELSSAEERQEIYGEFLEAEITNPFAHQYSKDKHESVLAVEDKTKKLFIAIDFNLNPFAASFEHIWRDAMGYHDHVFNEVAIDNGSVSKMIEYIGNKYRHYLPTCSLTGDAGGKAGQLSDDNARSFFRQLQDGLSLHPSQIQVRSNPTHVQSRNDVNYFLQYYPDFKINPATCPETCKDMVRVQCNSFGEIIKANRNDASQRGDFLDGRRYSINTWQKQWIETHRRKRIKT